MAPFLKNPNFVAFAKKAASKMEYKKRARQSI
jgi:hypothetical protein